MRVLLSLSLALPIIASAQGQMIIGSTEAQAISNTLASHAVVLQTPDNIDDLVVTAPIHWNNNNSLTLAANRNIIFMGQGSLDNTAQATVTLQSDAAAQDNGLVLIGNNATSIQSQGQINLIEHPALGSALPNNKDQIAGHYLQMEAIDTPNDLQNISQNLKGSYYLNQNLNMKGFIFKPMGDMSTPFSGTFIGNHHLISNLTISAAQNDNVGVFGVIGPQGFVVDLSFDRAMIAGQNSVGILAGVNEGHINDISVQGEVNGVNNVGGLIGVNNRGTVQYTQATTNINASQDFSGGLAGTNSQGTISQSSSHSNIISQGSHVGSLTGDNYEGFLKQDYAWGSVVGEDNIGGLTGGNDSGIINNCGADVTVTGLGLFIGGLSGDNVEEGVISTSYSLSPVLQGKSYVGGLIGHSDGTVTNSFWDIDTSHQSGSSGGLGKSDEAMRTRSTYIGWNFNTIWKMQVYPALAAL